MSTIKKENLSIQKETYGTSRQLIDDDTANLLNDPQFKKFGFKLTIAPEVGKFNFCKASGLGTDVKDMAIDCTAGTVSRIYELIQRIVFRIGAYKFFVVWPGCACGYELFMLAWAFPEVVFIGMFVIYMLSIDLY